MHSLQQAALDNTVLSEGIVAKSPMEQGGLWPSAVVSNVLSADDAATEGSMRAGHAWDDESDIGRVLASNREGACIQCDAVVHHSHLSQYCSQCQGLLCETCAVSHGRMKVFRHHQIRVLPALCATAHCLCSAAASRDPADKTVTCDRANPAKG